MTFTRGAEKAVLVEIAEVENTGAIRYGKPPKQKTLRYQECRLKRSGLRRSLNDAHEQRPGVYTSRHRMDSRCAVYAQGSY